MKTLLTFLRPYKKECLIGPFFKLLEAILELLLPTVMALLIDRGVLGRDSSYVIKMGFVMILMSLLGFGCSLVCQYQAAKASQGYGTDLRNALYAHISSLSYTELDQFGAPTLTTRLTNDINQLQLAVAMLIRLVVRAPFICIGAIIMAVLLNFKLSLILIGATPLFIGVLYFIITKTSPLYKLSQEKLDILSRIVRENLSGVRVIRAFSKNQHETSRFHVANDDVTKTNIRVTKLSALLSPATSLIMNMAIVLILWSGFFQIRAGSFTQGEMIAYINYVTQVLLALIVISNLIIIFTKAYSSALRVAEVLHTAPSIVSHEEVTSAHIPKPSKGPLIVFKDVSFSYYSSADMALENINLQIDFGENIGIIGATGSGKTTLIHLMGRFYEATSGSIEINGIPIKSYPLSQLRKLIAYVPQKSILISGTIADNLHLGNQDASEEELKRAAEIAQAADFILSLPEGWQTKVERGGQNFSGGQKQRLAIARALVANPLILVLDDSSSALDFATEARLRESLKKHASSACVITISQRASSILHCDKIFVMDDGQIAGWGTHHQLLKTCEVYREICLSQMSEEEVYKEGGIL